LLFADNQSSCNWQSTPVGGSCQVRCANNFSPPGGQSLGYNADKNFTWFQSTCNGMHAATLRASLYRLCMLLLPREIIDKEALLVAISAHTFGHRYCRLLLL
jgi:hypothetical protein